MESLRHGLARFGPKVRRSQEALAFASWAHGSQRYGSHPYSVHLKEVMATVRELGFGDERHMVVAALHDYLEDTDGSPEVLRRKFGLSVASAVEQLSRKPDVEVSVYIASMEELAFAVKLADRLSNLRHNGRSVDPAELAHQKGRIYPKYVSEQPFLEARAQELAPTFDRAIAHVRDELEAAGLRLASFTARASYF